MGIILCTLKSSELLEEWRRDKHLATSGQEAKKCIRELKIADLVGSSIFLLQINKSIFGLKIRGKNHVTEIANPMPVRYRAMQATDEALCVALRTRGNCKALRIISKETQVYLLMSRQNKHFCRLN